jgi:hypothetical protein
MLLIVSLMLLSGCSMLGGANGVPEGSVAWCGDFEYTGTWLKTETNGRALGVSDSAVVERMSVEDVIALAQAMGCPTD